LPRIAIDLSFCTRSLVRLPFAVPVPVPASVCVCVCVVVRVLHSCCRQRVSFAQRSGCSSLLLIPPFSFSFSLSRFSVSFSLTRSLSLSRPLVDGGVAVEARTPPPPLWCGCIARCPCRSPLVAACVSVSVSPFTPPRTVSLLSHQPTKTRCIVVVVVVLVGVALVSPASPPTALLCRSGTRWQSRDSGPLLSPRRPCPLSLSPVSLSNLCLSLSVCVSLCVCICSTKAIRFGCCLAAVCGAPFS
jgi:hypothetical protein